MSTVPPGGDASVTIRAAQSEDLSRVCEIYAHHVLCGTATFELVVPSLDEMARRHADVVARGLPWLVAQSGGVVVGFAYAGAYRQRPAYDFTVEDSIYLDPAWTKRGIGRALLARVIAECEQAGRRQMIAVIGDSANAASVAVHRALSFSDVGVIRDVGFKFGRWIDTVVMQRALGDGARTIPEVPARARTHGA